MVDLVEARRRGDPLADAVVRESYPEGRSAVGALNQALRSVDRNNDAVPDGIPASLRTYLDSGADVGRAAGGWDEERLALGARLHVDYVFHLPIVLQFGTMPLLYCGADGVKVLAFTGRLSRHTHRRAVESGQFVHDVMDPAGFAPSGRARRTAQKVRLLHAAVRHAILSSGEPWDVDVLGVPIHQAHLLGTMFSFTITVLDGLARLGAVFSEAEAEAYYYRWTAIGQLMGIEPGLIPPSLDDARGVFTALQDQSFGTSEEGRRLWRSWLVTLEEQVPIPSLHPSFPALTSWLAGDRAADALGLPRGDEVAAQLGDIGRWFTQFDGTLQHGSRIRRGVNTLAQSLYTVIYLKERGLERASFELPTQFDPGWAGPAGASPAVFGAFVEGLPEADKHVILAAVPRLMGMVGYADGRLDTLERSEARRLLDREIEQRLGEDFRWSWEARQETARLFHGERPTPAEDQAWLTALSAIVDHMPADLQRRFGEGVYDLCARIAGASGTLLWLGVSVSRDEARVLQRIRDALRLRATADVALEGTAGWAHLRRRDLAVGEVLWHAGDPSGDSVVFLEAGKVEVVRDGVRIDTSGAGEILGEMGLFTGRPRSATVRALSPARLWSLDRAGYEALRAEGSVVVGNLERRLLEVQGARLRRLDRWAQHGLGGAPVPAPGVLERLQRLWFAGPRVVASAWTDPVAGLAASPLFRGESRSAVGAIVADLTRRRVPAGQYLMRQGEASDDVMFVLAGRADVFATSEDGTHVTPLQGLEPGSVCGISALLGDVGREVSALARTDVEVLVLPRDRWAAWRDALDPVASTLRAAMIRAYAAQLDAAGGLAASVAR